ncbi:MAG: hypothetical protein ACLGI6_07795 [Gammaproteobacteria bacterium]
MTPHTLARHLLAAGFACAALAAVPVQVQAQAGADIVKCVGRDGRITLTDEPCRSGERSVTLVAGAKADSEGVSPAAAPTFERTAHMVRSRLPDTSVARSTLARLDPPSRSLARDVATLRAARRAMQLMDGAAGPLHTPRIALH